MKILVLRGGALGDFILTTPALRLLRARWPDAHIELVGNASAAELGLLDGVINAAYSQHEARWAALYSSDPLPAPLREWLGAYDCVINFWPDPEGELARHFPLRPGQQFLSAAAKPECAPASRHFCEALKPLGLSTDDFQARLHLPGPSSAPRSASSRPMLCLHPGSSSSRRNWPVERWAQVCAQFRSQNYRVCIVGGEADASIMERLAEQGECFASLPLPDLARLLAQACLYLGHDTGVSHLAAALSIPSLILFGPSDPAVWAPLGKHVTVLQRGDSMEAISVEDVREMLILNHKHLLF